MKLAFISSVHWPHVSDCGTMEMALTHLVLKHEGYTERLQGRRQDGVFVLLDNSVFELGKSMSSQAIIEAAQLINPSEVVCPDVLYKGDATVAATRTFISEKGRELMRINPRVTIMGVPQGSSRLEWLTCAEDLSKLVDTVGLSKISIPECFGKPGEPLVVTRRRALEALCRQTSWGTRTTPGWAHLLGGDWSLGLEIAGYTNDQRVRSCDSSLAWWYGMHGIGLSDKLLPMQGRVFTSLTTRPELELEYRPQVAESVDDCMAGNIRTLLEVAK